MAADIIKNKSINNIEKHLAELDPASMRYKVLESAKNFKSSWFTLGQYLYTVYKDKLYKEWGFMAFDSYCVKEISIRKETAVKLLKSYFFIEKEEPDLAKAVPNFDAVNILRLAKANKNIDEESYQEFKKDVFQKQKDPRDIKKELHSMLVLNRREANPEEEQKKAFNFKLRRVIWALKSVKLEVEIKNVLPDKLIKQLDALITALEEKLE